jgi:hypothetical protein
MCTEMKNDINHRVSAQRNSRGYHHALKRLDAFLENGDEGCNAEKIEILGRHMFGELWHARNNQATSLAAIKTT